MQRVHLGSGNQTLDGWLNLDKVGHSGVRVTDLSKPLNFLADNTVEYVFSEHFLEHIDEQAGFNLLRECFRFMKPGGIIRTTTPDLEKYARHYLDWKANRKDYDPRQFTNGCRFLNYAMIGEAENTRFNYMNGLVWPLVNHRYIYDFEDLSTKLASLGFVDIVREEHGRSNHSVLNGIERHQARRDLVVEARKP